MLFVVLMCYFWLFGFVLCVNFSEYYVFMFMFVVLMIVLFDVFYLVESEFFLLVLILILIEDWLCVYCVVKELKMVGVLDIDCYFDEYL